ncbi:MAG: hypothetical protein J6S75_15545, partial [Thermoguttaceae bacterium]|nr:hypothetical protein [Thermoguttaceae bacterium]
MKKELEVALFAVTAMFAMTLTGCKSTSAIKSPFASKPDPHIASPAEMDDLQLKAPPESYTKDDPKTSAKEAHSLAQQGEYKTPGADIADERQTAAAADSAAAAGASESNEPLRMAMNPAAVQDNIPSDSRQGNYSSIPSTGSTYPEIPGLSYGAAGDQPGAG